MSIKTEVVQQSTTVSDTMPRFEDCSVSPKTAERNRRKRISQEAHALTVLNSQVKTPLLANADKEETGQDCAQSPNGEGYKATILTFRPANINSPHKMRRFLSHLRDEEGNSLFRYMPRTKKVMIPKMIHDTASYIVAYLKRPAIQDRYGKDHHERREDVVRAYNRVFGNVYNDHNNENIYRSNALSAVLMGLQMEARNNIRNGYAQHAQRISDAIHHIRFIHDTACAVENISTLTVDEFNYIKAKATDAIIIQLVDVTWRLEELRTRKEKGYVQHDGSELETVQIQVVNHDSWYKEVCSKKDFSLDALQQKIQEQFGPPRQSASG